MKHTLLFAVLLCGTPLIGQQFMQQEDALQSHAIYLRTMDVQVADLNKDGYPDIVLAIEWAPNAILWGSADGIYRDNHLMKLSTNKYDSEDVAIGDYDGDGWLDLVFAAEDDMNHEYYRNNGDGSFTEQKNKFPAFIANSVLAHDFNGDGALDLLFGCQGQNRLFINNGKGEFTDETTKRLPTDTLTTQDIALIDFDVDGDMDLIIGNENGNQLWLNTGKGYFKDATQGRFPSDISIETRKVIVFDCNGDGKDDVFLCNVNSDEQKDVRDRLYINDGKGRFIDYTQTHLPNQEYNTLDAVVVDLNLDGQLDVVLGHRGRVQPSVFVNTGNGKFVLDTHLLSHIQFLGNYISMVLYDFNGDGWKDLYFGGFMSDDRLIYFGGGR